MTRTQFIADWEAALAVIFAAAVIVAVPAFAIPWRNERLRWLQSASRWSLAILVLVLLILFVLPFVLLRPSGRPA